MTTTINTNNNIAPSPFQFMWNTPKRQDHGGTQPDRARRYRLCQFAGHMGRSGPLRAAPWMDAPDSRAPAGQCQVSGWRFPAHPADSTPGPRRFSRGGREIDDFRPTLMVPDVPAIGAVAPVGRFTFATAAGIRGGIIVGRNDPVQVSLAAFGT